MTATRSPFKGDIEITQRDDMTGGDLVVHGSVKVMVNGSETDIMTLFPTVYSHTQAEAENIWSINHNLGTVRPSVQLMNSDGAPMIGRVAYDTATENTILIYFAVPASGTAVVVKN